MPSTTWHAQCTKFIQFFFIWWRRTFVLTNSCNFVYFRDSISYGGYTTHLEERTNNESYISISLYIYIYIWKKPYFDFDKSFFLWRRELRHFFPSAERYEAVLVENVVYLWCLSQLFFVDLQNESEKYKLFKCSKVQWFTLLVSAETGHEASHFTWGTLTDLSLTFGCPLKVLPSPGTKLYIRKLRQKTFKPCDEQRFFRRRLLLSCQITKTR